MILKSTITTGRTSISWIIDECVLDKIWKILCAHSLLGRPTCPLWFHNNRCCSHEKEWLLNFIIKLISLLLNKSQNPLFLEMVRLKKADCLYMTFSVICKTAFGDVKEDHYCFPQNSVLQTYSAKSRKINAD